MLPWRCLVVSSPSPTFHDFVHPVSSVFPFPLSPPGETLPIHDPIQMPCLRGSFFTKTILPSSRVDGTFLCTTLDMSPVWPLIHHVFPYLSLPLACKQGSVLLGPCRKYSKCWIDSKWTYGGLRMVKKNSRKWIQLSVVVYLFNIQSSSLK